MNSATAESHRGAGAPPGTVRTLKREGRRGVYLVRGPDGILEVVKRWPATPWELFKLCIGISQAQRQLRGARRLLAARVATARPRGEARLTTLGGFAVQIRMEWIEGDSLLDRVRGAEVAEQRRLGERMAELLHRLRAAGLFHRDGKLSNFVVTPTGDIAAIDPVGVRGARNEARERERTRWSLGCELSETERLRCSTFLETSGASPAP